MRKMLPKSSRGWTLIELLIVTTILALLILASVAALGNYTTRAQDARRKADLKKITIALDQYYNDHGGYPEMLKTPDANGAECGSGTSIKAYMPSVPCDVRADTPYLYIPFGTPRTNTRGEHVYNGYRLLAALQYSGDPGIADQGCDGPCGGTKLDGVTAVPEQYNWGFAANAQLKQ